MGVCLALQLGNGGILGGGFFRQGLLLGFQCRDLFRQVSHLLFQVSLRGFQFRDGLLCFVLGGSGGGKFFRQGCVGGRQFVHLGLQLGSTGGGFLQTGVCFLQFVFHFGQLSLQRFLLGRNGLPAGTAGGQFLIQ